MSHFSQNPANTKKKSSFSLSSIGSVFKNEPERGKYRGQYKNRKEKPRKKTETNFHNGVLNNERNSERKSRLSFTVPSAATLAIVAGTVLIALTALNWENIKNLRTPENYVFPPAVSENIEGHALRYAATGISDITSAIHFPEGGQAAAAESNANPITIIPAGAEISNLNNEGEAPHDLLVTFQWSQYRVQRGDAVDTIAAKYGVSRGAIIASNEIRNVRLLQEGALLRIPNIDGIPYTIKSGDSLLKIAATFDVPLEVILDVNDIRSDTIRAGETIFIPGARMNDMDLRASLGDLFIYPVQSKYVTSSYGMRKDPISGQLSFHTGVDLRGNKGATVMAAMDGVVSVVSENWLYGKYIILSHSNGFKTLYAHLNSQSVKVGDRVTQGRKIGEVGDTGYSTGPHLHFSIYDKDGKYVNPLDLINK